MNRLSQMFELRVRGFRTVELGGFAVLLVIVFTLYVFKTGAGAEGARITDTSRQITEEQRKVRLLKAELAGLEAPDRLERLSAAYLGMAPVDARRETGPGGLAQPVRAVEGGAR